jgi:hypothetical protein
MKQPPKKNPVSEQLWSLSFYGNHSEDGMDIAPMKSAGQIRKVWKKINCRKMDAHVFTKNSKERNRMQKYRVTFRTKGRHGDPAGCSR